MARVALHPYFPKDISNLILSYNGPTKEKELIFKLQKRKLVISLKNDFKYYKNPAYYYNGYFNSLKIYKILDKVIETAVSARYTKNILHLRKLLLRAREGVNTVRGILDKFNFIKFSKERRRCNIAERMTYFIENNYESCEALTIYKTRCKNKGTFQYKNTTCKYHSKHKYQLCYNFYKNLEKTELHKIQCKYVEHFRY